MTNVIQMTEAKIETNLLERARRGRVAALAGLRAKAAEAGNVVSIFENTIPMRAPVPVFHSRRVDQNVKPTKLLLTNPIAA